MSIQVKDLEELDNELHQMVRKLFDILQQVNEIEEEDSKLHETVS